MTAIKKSSTILLCLVLAIICLVGLFSIIDSSSAHASPNEYPQAAVDEQSGIVITPTELQATLHLDEVITQTLWITNTGDTLLTYTIYEMSAGLGLERFSLLPVVNPVFDPNIQLDETSGGETEVIIFLREQPDLSPAYNIPNRIVRAQYVFNRLLDTASHSQKLYDWLEAQGTHPNRLLTTNAIVATLNNSQLAIVRHHPQVRHIKPNQQYQITPAITTSLMQPWLPIAPSVNTTTVEWNISKIRADETWETFGIRGEGAVVGVVDTGVMYHHPALVNSYRGNLGGGNFDHNYHWFDFVSGLPAPYDDHGHGTMITGIITGDDGGSNKIGAAPDADWIAVKACTGGGSCSLDGLHAALQWMLAPTDLMGNNPNPSKAPKIIIGGWGSSGCDNEFEFDLMVLRAAGILPVFSPGGSGSACNSMGSPGDLPEALSAGATDQNDNIASFSSRGPSCTGEIKPDLSAPGVTIRSSMNDGNYSIWSGTALSAAHAAGSAALVFSANASLGPEAIEEILFITALCRENLTCLGDPCPGANNVYGHGRIDAFEAVSATIGIPPFNLPWLSEAPMSGTLTAGQGVRINVTFDSAGLDIGTYSGGVGISSSDPITPFASLPVVLNVINQPIGPIIDINPTSFSTTLPITGIETVTLTIGNNGDSVLTFTLYEVTASQVLLSAPVNILMPTSDPLLSAVPAPVDPVVHTQLLFNGHTRLILYLRGQADLSASYAISDQDKQGQYVYNRLLETAEQSVELYDWLVSQGTEPRRLLTANTIAATLDETQLETVISFPQVARVGVNGYADILQDGPAAWNWLHSKSFLPNTVEWNISKIRADETWSIFGIRGSGAVVGIVDTGVMYNHPALVSSYRGNQGNGIFDHNYNWFDFFDSQPVPYDDNGHGTFGTGIIVGDDGVGNQIGVAPGAQWIAYKALDAGGGSVESLHSALEWMLAPTDISGNNPNPKLAPNVVLNMWRYSACDHSFYQDLAALRAANILPIFAPGGEGPGCGTVAYPAASPDALSAGATDINDVISGFSSKGPSCDDGSIKPDLSAPGVYIRSSTLDGGYQSGWSGTSFSTAHLAGAAALLFSADTRISLDELEQTLFDTAICHDETMYCGGEQCPGANNAYGYGRIDVFEAVSITLKTNPPYDLPWLNVGPLVGVLPPGQMLNINVTFDAFVVPPGVYQGGIGIESNDSMAPFTLLPVTLTVIAPCEPLGATTMTYFPGDPVVGEVITFTAYATGTLPISYTWVFDDGSSSASQQVNHIFESPGLHVVALKLENACDLEEMEIVVPVEMVIQRFLLPLVIR